MRPIAVPFVPDSCRPPTHRRRLNHVAYVERVQIRRDVHRASIGIPEENVGPAMFLPGQVPHSG